jgi:hypothetical protein
MTRFWLTLKQFKFETVAASVLSLVAGVGALIEAWRLNSLNTPVECLPKLGTMIYSSGAGDSSTACAAAARRFNDLVGSPDMVMVGILLLIVPFAVGILLGAPVVAREIEEGTASFAWTMQRSRARWLAFRMLSLMVLMVPLLFFVGVAADLLAAAKNPTVDVHAAFVDYASRGLFPLAWGLAAFAGAAWVGAVAGRAMPAVLTVGVASVLIQGLWVPIWSQVLLEPFAVPVNMDGGNANLQVDQWSYLRYFLDGKPFSEDVDAWWAAHPVTLPPINGPVSSTAGPDAQPTSPTTAVGPVEVDYMIVAKDLYWPVTVTEASVLLATSILLTGATLLVVERRRPY